MYYPNPAGEPKTGGDVPESIETVTVSDVVRRAVALVDPEGRDDIAPELLIAYEDDDRAVVGLSEELWEELRTTVEGLDPEGDSGATAVAAATAFFLSTHPEGGSDERRRRSARACAWPGRGTRPTPWPPGWRITESTTER
jgi:hypothetical protein